MKKLHIYGAAAAALLLGTATTAFAQSSGGTSSTGAAVATTESAPLVPGGAAGEPARSPVASFWASLTGDAPHSDAKAAVTASTDTNTASAR